MEAYAVWNNKGGTGKSTVTFHIASRFAEKNPDRKVLVVDMCPKPIARCYCLEEARVEKLNYFFFARKQPRKASSAT